MTLPYWRFDQPAPNVFNRRFMGVANAVGSVEFVAGHPLNTWRTDGALGISRTPSFAATVWSPGHSRPGEESARRHRESRLMDGPGPVQEPLRGASARSPDPPLILRTASASPCPRTGERADAAPADRAEHRVGGSRGPAIGEVSPAGASAMVASTFKTGMPIRRARIQASTRTPSERRLLGSGTTVTPVRALALDDLGICTRPDARGTRNHPR